jgi:hypothetical protein
LLLSLILKHNTLTKSKNLTIINMILHRGNLTEMYSSIQFTLGIPNTIAISSILKSLSQA